MNAFARALLFALPLLAVPSLARAQCALPSTVTGGIGFNCNLNWGGPKPVAGPWFAYFPYNAYFATPAPVCGWPFWPTGAAVNAAPGGAGAVGRGPRDLQGLSYAPRGIQPVGYYGQAPSYWYGR
jgi:hypothetical protein